MPSEASGYNRNHPGKYLLRGAKLTDITHRMKQGSPSIYDYQDPRRFLLDWLVARQATEPGFSVRKWAKKMALSHALLVMLLQGKRGLRLKHVPALSLGMDLTPAEKTYLQALIELAEAKSIEAETLARNWIRELNPGAQVRTREIDEFEMISSWIHFAILALCQTEDFDGTRTYFKKRLEPRATAVEVRAAVSRLFSLGLLGTLPNGKIFAAQSQVSTKNDRASAAVRKYHSDVSQLASQAVQEQDVLEREFQSLAIAVHRDQIPMVKEMIRKFRSQLVEALSERKGTDVYNVNLQFFRLTESPVEIAKREPRSEDEGADTVSHPLSQEESHVLA